MSQITKQEIETLFKEHSYITPLNAEDLFGMEGLDNILYDILISVGWKSSQQKDK